MLDDLAFSKKLAGLLNNKIGGTLIECGAYDGKNHSLGKYFEDNLAWKCINIEPQPRLFELLSLHHRTKSFMNANLALSNVDGTLEMRVPIKPSNGKLMRGHGTIDASLIANHPKEKYSDDRVEKHMVRTTTYKHFIESNNIKEVDLFILDVEGHELAVIDGMKGARVLPKLMAIETNKSTKQEVLDRLSTLAKWEIVYSDEHDTIYKLVEHKVDKILGFGGLGDCFMCALKCLEHDTPYIYTHIDTSLNRLRMSKEVLDRLDVPNDCIHVNDIRGWWHQYQHLYSHKFNVFAKGYIDIPIRPYHWEPCRDRGLKNPFLEFKELNEYQNQHDYVVVQVGAGMSKKSRNHTQVPIVDYALENYDHDKIYWVGIDDTFECKSGINLSGRMSFMGALNLVASSQHFVGFNSILLYWALAQRSKCVLFMDHQGREDLRIHDLWRENIIDYVGKGYGE